MKAEAKRFMSGRADKVHTTGPSQPRTQLVPAETSFSRKDFLAAQKEAQQLGTPGQCLISVLQAKVAETQGVSSGPSGHPGYSRNKLAQHSRRSQMGLRCKAPSTDTHSLCCAAAGAEAMQPHARRQLEAQNLAKLGMKAKPQQRMGAKIGLSESCCPGSNPIWHPEAYPGCRLAWRNCCRFEQVPPAWRWMQPPPSLA